MGSGNLTEKNPQCNNKDVFIKYIYEYVFWTLKLVYKHDSCTFSLRFTQLVESAFLNEFESTVTKKQKHGIYNFTTGKDGILYGFYGVIGTFLQKILVCVTVGRWHPY